MSILKAKPTDAPLLKGIIRFTKLIYLFRNSAKYIGYFRRPARQQSFKGGFADIFCVATRHGVTAPRRPQHTDVEPRRTASEC